MNQNTYLCERSLGNFVTVLANTQYIMFYSRNKQNIMYEQWIRIDNGYDAFDIAFAIVFEFHGTSVLPFKLENL